MPALVTSAPQAPPYALAPARASNSCRFKNGYTARVLAHGRAQPSALRPRRASPAASSCARVAVTHARRRAVWAGGGRGCATRRSAPSADREASLPRPIPTAGRDSARAARSFQPAGGRAEPPNALVRRVGSRSGAERTPHAVCEAAPGAVPLPAGKRRRAHRVLAGHMVSKTKATCGGRRPGAGRPRTVKHVRRGRCQCARCRNARGRA
jgi:hypothetical protein